MSNLSIINRSAAAVAATAIAVSGISASAGEVQANGPDASFLLKGGHQCVSASRSFRPEESNTAGLSNEIRDGGFILKNNNPDVDYVWVKGRDAGIHATGSYVKPNGVVEQFGLGHFPNQNGLIEYSSISGVGAVNTSIPFDNGNGPLGAWGESNKILNTQSNGRVGDGVNTLFFHAPNNNSQELFVTLGDIGPDDVGKTMHISVRAPGIFLAKEIQRSFALEITPESYDPTLEIATMAIPLTDINARRVGVTIQSLDASHVTVGADVGYSFCEREGGDNEGGSPDRSEPSRPDTPSEPSKPDVGNTGNAGSKGASLIEEFNRSLFAEDNRLIATNDGQVYTYAPAAPQPA